MGLLCLTTKSECGLSTKGSRSATIVSGRESSSERLVLRKRISCSARRSWHHREGNGCVAKEEHASTQSYVGWFSIRKPTTDGKQSFCLVQHRTGKITPMKNEAQEVFVRNSVTMRMLSPTSSMFVLWWKRVDSSRRELPRTSICALKDLSRIPFLRPYSV